MEEQQPTRGVRRQTILSAALGSRSSPGSRWPLCSSCASHIEPRRIGPALVGRCLVPGRLLRIQQRKRLPCKVVQSRLKRGANKRAEGEAPHILADLVCPEAMLRHRGEAVSRILDLDSAGRAVMAGGERHPES